MSDQAAKSPIFTDIDFEADGKQVSTLNLPHSPHADAWGVMPIPIAVTGAFVIWYLVQELLGIFLRPWPGFIV